MGILDSIMGAVEQHPEINQEQHSNLLQTTMEVLGHGSALPNVLNNAESQGLGGIVHSWINNGPNQGVAPQQVPNILGQDRVNEIASRVGIPPMIATAALSRILPVLVDKLTPNGKLPQAA